MKPEQTTSQFPFRWCGMKAPVSDISARQAIKAPQRANRGSECVRAKRCKPAGLCRSDTVDLHPHWRQQNRDAVCTEYPFEALPVTGFMKIVKRKLVDFL